MMTVGIDIIPSCIGTDGFSSMSIFTTLILSPSSPWICSTIGAIIRQGPHHVAQKSTIFFFQAEDGIRDWSLTGVQTCALPISFQPKPAGIQGVGVQGGFSFGDNPPAFFTRKNYTRSEERRVGKECRSRWER